MIASNRQKPLTKRAAAAIALSVSLSFCLQVDVSPALAQKIAQVPLPGSGISQPGNFATAPVPGQQIDRSQPNPSGQDVRTRGNVDARSAYQALPLSYDQARLRVIELRTMLQVSRPQDVQEKIFHLCEWLSDMADAHWKLSQALAKNESTRQASLQERQAALKFSSLKHEANLLKAELFIKQNRLPEALGPLVDIVVAEPKSATGLSAYEKLKEIGFSEEVAETINDPQHGAQNAKAPALSQAKGKVLSAQPQKPAR